MEPRRHARARAVRVLWRWSSARVRGRGERGQAAGSQLHLLLAGPGACSAACQHPAIHLTAGREADAAMGESEHEHECARTRAHSSALQRAPACLQLQQQ